MWKATRLACALVLFAASASSAQQVREKAKITPRGTQETIKTTPAPAQAQALAPATPEMRKVSQILGSKVVLKDSNNFGKVHDIVLNNNGAIDYVVVSHDGRYAMLPWNAGTMNWTERAIRYDVTPKAIQPLVFTENAWPNTLDQQFITTVRRVFPGVIYRQSARPVPFGPPPGTLPPPGTRAPLPGTPLPPGSTAPAPGSTLPPGTTAPAPGTRPGVLLPAPDERVKIKEKPNGTVKEKDKERPQ